MLFTPRSALSRFRCYARNVSHPCSIDVYCDGVNAMCSDNRRLQTDLNISAAVLDFEDAVVDSRSQTAVVDAQTRWITSNSSISIICGGATVQCGNLHYSFALISSSGTSATAEASASIGAVVSRSLLLSPPVPNLSTLTLSGSVRDIDGRSIELLHRQVRVDISPPVVGAVECGNNGTKRAAYPSLSRVELYVSGASDTDSDLRSMRLEVLTADVRVISTLDVSLVESQLNTFALEWSPPLLPGSRVTARKTIFNQAGLSSSVISNSIVMDDSPPVMHGGHNQNSASSSMQRCSTEWCMWRMKPVLDRLTLTLSLFHIHAL